MSGEHVTRRNVLAAGAATAGAVTIAACGSGGDSEPSAPPKPEQNAELATLSEIPVGQAITTKTGAGEEIVVARPAEDSAKAFSASCTHMGCKVAPEGGELHCPCHGSVFDAMTGQVRKGPAKKPLPSVPVKVANGKVVAGE